MEEVHSLLITNIHIAMVIIVMCVCVCAQFLAPNAPPTDLVVFNETITSMNARWNPAPGRVQNYRITYVPTAGGRSQTVSLISDEHGIPTTHTVFIYKALSYLKQVISEHQNADCIAFR